MSLNIKLNPSQEIAYFSIFNANNEPRNPPLVDEVALFGGIRAGKSLVIMLIVFMLCQKCPGAQILFARATYRQLMDSVIVQFLTLFPADQCGYIYKKGDKEFHFDNGSIIYFRAFDNPSKVLSNEYDCVATCQSEQISEETMQMVLGRLSGKKTPANYVFCDGNPAHAWPKHRYYTRKKEGTLPRNVLFMDITTFENQKNLRDGYIDRLLREYGDQWVQRWVYGGWESVEDMVYTHFDPRKHVIDPIYIPKWWTKAIGFDYGITNPSAILWMAVDDKKNLYVFDEFYGNTTVDQYAEICKRHGDDIPVIIDTNTKIHERDGGSVYNDLLNFGVPLIPATKNKLANIGIVSALFSQDRMYFFNKCENSINEHLSYRWEKRDIGTQSNQPERVIKFKDHSCDAAQYAARWLYDQRSLDPSAPDETKTLKYIVERQQPVLY